TVSDANPQSQLSIYLDQSNAALEKFIDNLQRNDWTHEEDHGDISTYSRYDPELKRKIYKLQTILDYDYEWAFRQTWMTVPDSPLWNEDIREGE
ncbi:unnamed protein product, partial [Darwinula stevensoni]